MKTLLKFTITTDHEDFRTPVNVEVRLYKEEDGYVWRLDGPYGDECEALPRPKSIRTAKEDAILVYPYHSPFKPRAAWMKRK